MLTFLIILGWIVCGFFAYLLLRSVFKKIVGEPWTTGDRMSALALSLGGPVSIAAALFIWGFVSLGKGDKKAKW